MSETLAVRVVRTVQSVAPRRLTGLQIVEALPDDNSSTVYGTVSYLAKDHASCPLEKKRSTGGVYDYGIRPGFDVEGWASGKKPLRPRADEATRAIEPAALEIIRVIREKGRLSGNQIEEAGAFTDRKAMFVCLRNLCDDGQPLHRDSTGNGAPFYYELRPGFDIESWLIAAGADQEIVASQNAAAAKAPAPASAAHVAPPKGDSVPGAVAGPRTVHGRDTSGVARRPIPSFTKPAPAPSSERTMAVQPISAKPPTRSYADIFAELERSSLDDLIKRCEAHSDPVLKSRAQRCRVLRELREEFAGGPT